MKKLILLFSLLSLLGTTFAASLADLQLPPGFKINIYANVPNARSMTLGDEGIVYVGTRKDKVYAVVPNANKTEAEKVITLASNLDTPNGVAYHDGALYVAEITRILKFPDITHQLDRPTPQVVSDQLPKQLDHGWRYIKFGPDGWLYIGVGMPCNICQPKDERFGTIMRMQPDGSQFEIYASGIRNTVGFAWQPWSKELWFTENGRDWLGDNLPPDELNRAPKAGLNFGFPYYFGKNIPDPKFSEAPLPVNNYVPALLDLPAHVAPLGMTFYTGKQFPTAYHDQIFIAEHGSWNRSKKVGYEVIWVTLVNNKVINWRPFVSGWLKGQTDWGRPVDVLVMRDGSLLISDDKAGLIYRVSYS